jgi:uncharacterized cupredoxin-like copper-binding protein
MRRRSTLLASLTAGLLLAGCAADDSGSATSPADEEVGSVEPAEDDVAEDAEPSTSDEADEADGEMGDHAAMMSDEEHAEMMSDGGAAAPTTIGEPADGSEADRTIEVDAFDMAFDLERIEVEAGEVVTFVVTNTGEAVHEFTLGDAAMQQEHADEMAADAQGHSHDDAPNTVTVDPGETEELTWRFGDAGEIQYACHVPGHYQAGMHGELVIS